MLPSPALGEGPGVRVNQPTTMQPLPVTDLQELPQEEREAAARRVAAEEAAAPFDLVTGPPVRAHLVVVAEDDQVLCITLHHIVGDGWSLGVLLREFATLYTAFDQDRSDPLPALPIQYTQHAAWQRGDYPRCYVGNDRVPNREHRVPSRIS